MHGELCCKTTVQYESLTRNTCILRAWPAPAATSLPASHILCPILLHNHFVHLNQTMHSGEYLCTSPSPLFYNPVFVGMLRGDEMGDAGVGTHRTCRAWSKVDLTCVRRERRVARLTWPCDRVVPGIKRSWRRNAVEGGLSGSGY